MGEERKGFTIKEVVGDLFNSPTQFSLCHCVSSDFRMGRGIAVLFKQKFGRVDQLRAFNAKPGDIAWIRVNEPEERYVMYLVTKSRYYEKPTMNTLERSLQKMKELCLHRNITQIAMPRIGCGLDQMTWATVSQSIERIFRDTNIEIVVYSIA